MPEDDSSLAPFINPRKDQLVFAMVGVSLAVFFAVTVSIGLPRDGVLAPVWFANAIVVVALSATNARFWPFLLVAAAAGNFSAQVHGHIQGPARLCLLLSNVSEDCLAAWILRYGAKGRPDLSRGLVLARLAGMSVASGISSAVVSSLLLTLLIGDDFWRDFETWSVAHILGLMTITPCLMIVAQPRRYLQHEALKVRSASVVAFLLLVTAAVFGQNKYPILFLIPPALLLVSLELETFGAAAGVLIVEVFAIASLYTHTGPMTLIHGDPIEKAAIVQIFLLACLAISLPVAALNANRRQAMDTAKKSEEKYRFLAENAGDMITQCAPDSEVTFITPSCHQVLGYLAEELVGRKATELLHPEDLPVVRAYYARLIERGGHHPEPLQFRMRRRSGEWVWLEGQPKIFFDPVTSRLTAIQDVVRDVTSRKELEFKLSRAQSEAEAASVVKSEFMSNMSHELRTPLTSILGFSALLQGEDSLTDQSRRAVERIDSSSQALLAIVNDILDFSKLEAGQVEIQKSPTALAPLLEEALSRLEPQAEAKGLTLSMRRLDDVPERMLIAPSRVVQILTNLLGNAIKFTQSGGVTLEALYNVDAQRLRLTVVDTGVGISEAGLSRLFQRFSQVDGSTTRQFGGTGLGLAICKGLVDAMGGEIGATSHSGTGSAFWFEIPCAPAEAREPDADPGPSGDALNGLRILLAEGDQAQGGMIRSMLTSRGVDVTEAETGEEAATLAEEMPFDLIILDLRLPGLDGEATARAIRSGVGPNDLIPILALTRESMDRVRVKSRGSPFDDCLGDPIVSETFLKTLNRWADPEAAPLQQAFA